MSWFARKFTKSDIVDHKEVIKEYFEQKAQIEQKEIEKFWAEYKEDQHER